MHIFNFYVCIFPTLLAIMFFSGGIAMGEQKIRVGVYQNSPKVSMSESGKPEGIFVDIIEAIAAMDADVITIETSRSQMELLDAFAHFKYPNNIGPGHRLYPVR